VQSQSVEIVPCFRLMRIMKTRSLILFLLFVIFPVFGNAKADTNLALHKTYTLRPNPDYPLCTDELDSKQLTDGKKHGSDWRNKSTVGWRVNENPEIIFDLEKSELIDQVNICTAGGGAGNAYCPDFVVILVSSNGSSFVCAGAVMGRDTGSRQANLSQVAYTLTAKNLRTQGRYVKIILQPGSSYVFLDEIEIIGPDSTAEYPVAQMQPEPVKDTAKLFEIAEKQIQLKHNFESTEKYIEQQKVTESNWSNIKTDISLVGERFCESDRLLSVSEQNEFTNELGLIRARLYKEIYKKSYVCLQANSMDELTKAAIISDAAPAGSLDLAIWQAEYESAAVNIINCSNEPILVTASISPITGPNSIQFESKSTFTIRRGEFIKARRLGLIADALILQGQRQFQLNAGQVSQLWFTAFNPELKSGNYLASLGVLAVTMDGKELPTTVIPINLKVYPITFPKKIPLNVCNWAYPMRSDITKNNIAETAKDLKDHYTNVFVIPPADLPMPQIGSTAKSLDTQSFSQTDKLISANSYAETYLFFLGFKPERKDSGCFGSWMSQSWKRSFRIWIQRWVDHLKETGIGYDRFAMYPFDETLGDEFYQLAKEIKVIDPNIRIYANSFGQGTDDFMRFKDLVDIWCFSLPQCQAHPQWLETVKGFGKKVWLYDGIGPGKANDPYSYYRLMSWWAFKFGITGAGFWVYVDPTKEQNWDDTGMAMGHYGVVYGASANTDYKSSEQIIPSRRWEAWREGVEDYVYLKRFEEIIRKLNKNDSYIKEQLLKQLVNTVLTKPDDTTEVFRARELITTAIIEASDSLLPLSH